MLRSGEPAEIETSGPTFPPVSVAVIAKLFDLSERRIQQLVKQGVVSKTAHGKYDLLSTVREYVRYLHAMGGPSHADPEKMSPKERLDWYRGEMEKIRLAEARGKLIDAKVVVAMTSSLVAASRSRILAIPSKLRGRFSGIDEEVASEVDVLIREALTELGTSGLHTELAQRIGANLCNLDTAPGADG